MLIFSEYQTGSIDLTLDFYGYEDCPAGYGYGPAIRENYVLHYITSGQGVFHYNNQIIPLKKGDIFLLKPNELTYYQADQDHPWSYYWLGISGSKADDYFHLSDLARLSYLKQSKEVSTQSIGKLVQAIIEQAETLEKTTPSLLHILGSLYELLSTLGNLASNKEKNPIHPSYQIYLAAKHIIETAYTKEHFSIQALAEELNIHRSYLSSIFKEYSHHSPKELLLYVRMQRAKQLLEHTEEPIKFIAYSVGFSDPLYFSKAFKQFFGSSPLQFRKNSHFH